MLNKFFAFTIFAAVVGTANAQTAPTAPTERTVQRMTFGVPFETSYLGVQTEDISKENFSKYGLSTVRGVGVDKVVENSPAAKGGLQNGDVILKFEGEEVSSVRKLTRLIAEIAPDHTAKLTVLRDGSEREISVTLGKRDLPQFQTGNFRVENLPNLSALPRLPRTMPTVPLPPMTGGDSNVFIFRTGANRQIGVGVTPLTKQLGDYFGVAEGRGLLVNNVRENSPAAKAGLQAGDVIVEIEGKEVKSMPDLLRAISEKNEGIVSLTFIRDKNRQTINVTPEAAKEEKMKPEEFQRFFDDAPTPIPDN
ncbi:MAG: PDZ domain-containing protein [Pyrinomonadaceae bacterium]|nr:PDZ domain-containing protein [Pyrinomonadaceae bacterium]